MMTNPNILPGQPSVNGEAEAPGEAPGEFGVGGSLCCGDVWAFECCFLKHVVKGMDEWSCGWVRNWDGSCGRVLG